MAQWGLGETRYLKARKSTGSDLEEALSPISTTITSTSNDTNATRSPMGRGAFFRCSAQDDGAISSFTSN